MTRKPASKKRIPVRYARLFDALEKLVAGFPLAPGFEPFRIPDSPKPFGDLIAAFFGDADPVEIWNDAPDHLIDGVLYTAVDGGPGSSNGRSIGALTLPSKRRVYIESCEFSGLHVLASTPPGFTKDDVSQFLRFLFADNGARFGTFVFGNTIPSEFSIGVDLPREELIDLTYDLVTRVGIFDSLDGDGDWQVALPEEPRTPEPEWMSKLREKFGPTRGFAAGMGFAKVCEDYRKKHGIPDDPPGSEEEEKEYTQREIVDLWLQSQNVIENTAAKEVK